MNRLIKTTLILFVSLFVISHSANAAGMGMGMGTPCGGPFPPCPVPLDSNIILLLIAGALLGVYKIFVTYKKNPA